MPGVFTVLTILRENSQKRKMVIKIRFTPESLNPCECVDIMSNPICKDLLYYLLSFKLQKMSDYTLSDYTLSDYLRRFSAARKQRIMGHFL